MLKWLKSGYLRDLLQRDTDAIEFTKGRSNALLQRWTLNLNVAGNQTVYLAGNYLYAWDASDGTANIDVQFSRKDSDQPQYNLVRGLGFNHPFDKIHFSWAGQAGKTITLLIANLAPELFNVIDNRGSIGLTEILGELQGDVVPQGYNRVAIGAVATQILPANANRKSVFIQHTRGGAGIVYIGFSNAVTNVINLVSLAPEEGIAFDDYRGAIWGIRSAGATNVQYGEV